ncbi:hypothetical protein GCM10022226_02760 [Sphaerisporangium flaviroseum]|uniref:Uncharacterized protein n=1 Tax=Sphaerisporangium flaviroseum TaxID=509199 RepID=A0ABP7HBA9_9ACTN
MGGVARDATRVARLVQVEQAEAELGEAEQLLARSHEHVQIVDGEACLDRDVSISIDQGLEWKGGAPPGACPLRPSEDLLQPLTHALSLGILRYLTVH